MVPDNARALLAAECSHRLHFVDVFAVVAAHDFDSVDSSIYFVSATLDSSKAARTQRAQDFVVAFEAACGLLIRKYLFVLPVLPLREFAIDFVSSSLRGRNKQSLLAGWTLR